MKIALITGGHPRFTPDFITFMNQLKGFDQADIYINFWTTDWASSEEEARKKIEKILLPKYRLAKIKICDQPPYELPCHKINLPPAQPENVLWWYERRIGMWQSLKMAYDLIDQEYDAVIRFRVDGRFHEDLDLSKIDLKNNELIYQDYGRAGFDNYRISDVFTIGTQSGMKFYCKMADHLKELIPISDPNWQYRYNGPWSSEHLLGIYLQQHNKQQVFGDFKFHINWSGRSRYTDHHFHHRILPDPTEG